MIYWTALLIVLAACPAYAQTTINQAALDSLAAACKASNSSSYAVWVDGKPVVSWTADNAPELVECHSVLKSIASLAIGKLITDGKLDSVDTPVYTFFPEWKQGYRKAITIRHLLNHTSGIEFQEATMADWQDASDKVQIALCADLVSLPGDYFSYNNKAFMLLLGVLGRASGIPTHTYIEENIFAPLEISNYQWTFDKVGNTTGLATTSDELVKIGQLLLSEGQWNGTQLIAKEWVALSLQQGQPYVENCGLMWWRIPESTEYIVDDRFLAELEQAGIPELLREKFELLRGTYKDVNIPSEKLAAVFGENWQQYLDKEFYPYFPARSRREYSKNILGYKAEGWLGQYIVVYPNKRIVAARMVQNSNRYNAATDEMRPFEDYVFKVVE